MCFKMLEATSILYILYSYIVYFCLCWAYINYGTHCHLNCIQLRIMRSVNTGQSGKLLNIFLFLNWNCRNLYHSCIQLELIGFIYLYIHLT